MAVITGYSSVLCREFVTNGSNNWIFKCPVYSDTQKEIHVICLSANMDLRRDADFCKW